VIFLTLAGAFYTMCTVASPVLDDTGQQLLDESGNPRLQTDAWATWKKNWKANLLLAASCGFFLFALASGIREQIGNLKRKKWARSSPPSAARPRDG